MSARPAVRLEALESRDVPATTFTALPAFTGGLGSPQDIVVADFNRDGKSDFAVADNNFGIRVELGAGDGTFPVNVPTTDPNADRAVALTAGDFDGDGKLDLAVANAYGGAGESVLTFRGNGDGSFGPAQVLSNPFQPVGVEAADFTGDGKTDLLVITRFNGFEFNVGNGDGTFTPLTGVNGTFDIGRVALGDFDGDGKLDFVGYSSGNLVSFLGNGDGTFTPGAPTTSTFLFGFDIVAADFDGDGKLDVVTAADSTFRFFSNAGGGAFTPAASNIDPVANPGRLAVADFDRDGTADLVSIETVAGPATDLRLFFGTGDGTFTPGAGNGSTTAAPSARGLATLLADGDANPDFVVVGTSGPGGLAQVFVNDNPDPTATVILARPNPAGPNRPVVLTAVVTTPTVGGPPPTGTVTFFDEFDTVLGSADIGPDGRASIPYTTPSFPGSLRVFAVYSGDTLYAASSSPDLLLTVETTRLVFTTTDAGGVVDEFTFQTDATRAVTSKDAAFELGAPFTSGIRVASADFNGDGVPDILVGNGPALTEDERRALGAGPQEPLAVAVVDGVTRVRIAQFVPFEDSFTGGLYVAAGDLNGDGVPDIAVSADIGGGPRVRVYFSKAGGGFTPGADFFAIDDKNFRGGTRIAIGDVNADGVGDLIVVAGPGGGPRVAIYDGTSLAAGGTPTRLVSDFFALEAALTDGAFVAAGDIDGDGYADLTFGAGKGGSPRVVVFDGQSLIESKKLTELASFFASPPLNTGGVRVAMVDVDFDGKKDIITGAGTGDGSKVNTYLADAVTGGKLLPVNSRDAFPGLIGGVYVG